MLKEGIYKENTGLFIQDLATSIEILNNSNGIGVEVDL